MYTSNVIYDPFLCSSVAENKTVGKLLFNRNHNLLGQCFDEKVQDELISNLF